MILFVYFETLNSKAMLFYNSIQYYIKYITNCSFNLNIDSFLDMCYIYFNKVECKRHWRYSSPWFMEQESSKAKLLNKSMSELLAISRIRTKFNHAFILTKKIERKYWRD
jgi:hypothetical protein